MWALFKDVLSLTLRVLCSVGTSELTIDLDFVRISRIISCKITEIQGFAQNITIKSYQDVIVDNLLVI